MSEQVLSHLNPQTPRVFDGVVADARELASDGVEPVFVPQIMHADDRGWSLMNQLQGVMSPEGQINFSMQYPGVIKAWHRHHRQTDYWICLHGQVKVGVYNEQTNAMWMMVIGEKRAGVMVVPPTLWHGASTIGHEPAGLLYYVTRAYDPSAPDEDRRPYDSVEGFSWQVRHA